MKWKLPRPLKQMGEDLRAARERDPAAGSTLEVALLYPGLHAVWGYRLTHAIWGRGAHFPARVMQSVIRFFTGVDIHPAAQIGERLFIDHAMGVVVGETAEVGDDVLIFHGVTLGGVTMAPGKRHPTVGDRVVLGAGAKILGPVEIGADAKVGANAVVVHDVPDRGVAVGVPSHIVGDKGSRGSHTHGVLEPKSPKDSNEACTCLPSELDQALGVHGPDCPGHRRLSVQYASVQVRATYGYDDGVMIEPALYI